MYNKYRCNFFRNAFGDNTDQPPLETQNWTNKLKNITRVIFSTHTTFMAPFPFKILFIKTALLSNRKGTFFSFKIIYAISSTG